LHSHPESVAVFLTDANVKFNYPDGKREDIKAKAGSVQHMDAFTHLPEYMTCAEANPPLLRRTKDNSFENTRSV
jgi:hypothetical protein